MKKSIQESMNEYVEKNYEKMTEDFHEKFSHSFQEWTRLRNCQAFIIETPNYIVLKSYNTIVAFIDKMTCQKFDVLRMVYGYTSTSCQHINKFFKDYGDYRVNVYTYRDI